jgi:Tol biopolymer transport system component
MVNKLFIPVIILTLSVLACSEKSNVEKEESKVTKEEEPGENLRRITFEGESGEAYFSPDGTKLIYQSIQGDHPHYQIYTINVDGSGEQMISTGEGKTTCSYYTPDGKKIIYASTHHAPLKETEGEEEESRYSWDFDENFDIYIADPDGSNLTRLTTTEGYDAEGTFSPDGSRIVFTSNRDGDLELYTMNVDGSDPKRITNSEGYDGGAFYSPDGEKIIFRAFREGHRSAQVYLINADGTNEVQLTDTTGINWCPFFHPDGKTIIFSSNMADPKNFDLYTININGTGLKQITQNPAFDALPVFSADGSQIVFTSNRTGNSSLYMMDYVQ